jgi:hypothetical protein
LSNVSSAPLVKVSSTNSAPGEGEAEEDGDTEGDAELLGLVDDDGLTERLALDEGDTEGEAELDGLTEGEGLGVGEGEEDGDTEREAEEEGETEGEVDEDGETEAEGETEALGLTLALALALATMSGGLMTTVSSRCSPMIVNVNSFPLQPVPTGSLLNFPITPFLLLSRTQYISRVVSANSTERIFASSPGNTSAVTSSVFVLP